MLTNFRKALAQRANRTELYSGSDYWNEKAAAYDGSSVSMWRNQTLNDLYHAEQTQRLAAALADVHGQSLLDVGCGTGRMSRHFARLGARVTGVDFAESAVEIARAESDGLDIDYRTLSIFDLTDEARYDHVASWGSLTVACKDEADFRDTIRRMVRATKPGGRLMMFEPFHNSFLRRVLKLSRRRVIGILEEEGLSVQAAEHFHFWPVRLALAYFAWPGWLTRFGHACGALVLNGILRRKRFGDYQFILAVKPEAG